MHDATPTTTKVGEIVAGDYRTAAVFEKHGIDFCCGGSVTLAAACAEQAVDPAALARELEAATNAPARRDQDFAGWTLAHLINHVKAIHHGYLRANTAQNAAYARKIADVHGEQHPELARIVAAFDTMATGLLLHLQREEEVVFPAIERAEVAGRAGAAPEAKDAETIAQGVKALVREHDGAESALSPTTSTGMLQRSETCEHSRRQPGGVGCAMQSARARPAADPPVRLPRATLGIRAAADAAPGAVGRRARRVARVSSRSSRCARGHAGARQSPQPA